MHKGRSPPNPFKHAEVVRFTGEVALRIHWFFFLSTRMKKFGSTFSGFCLPRLKMRTSLFCWHAMKNIKKCFCFFLICLSSTLPLIPRRLCENYELWDTMMDLTSPPTKQSLVRKTDSRTVPLPRDLKMNDAAWGRGTVLKGRVQKHIYLASL